MAQRPPSPAEVFKGLRDQLFHGDLRALAPRPSGSAVSGPGPELIGVAMEVTFGTGTCLVFGLRDGSASVYLSSGGGSIGGHDRPHINAAAKKLVETAREFVARLPRVEEYPLPAMGRVRFSIFTSAGVYAGEGEEAELMKGRGELLPVFAGSHDIITGFRRVEQPEPSDEPSYVNCLLTTLARGTAMSVTLTDGSSPPDPARLTADGVDLTWIAAIGFALDRLSTRKIIRWVLRLAGFRWFQLGKTEGRIQVKLAAHGGESFSDSTFRVTRRRRESRIEVEITSGGRAS